MSFADGIALGLLFGVFTLVVFTGAIITAIVMFVRAVGQDKRPDRLD